MRILKCPKCGRTQKEGSFCLNDGSKLVEVITTDVRFRPIETIRTAEVLKKDIRRWLTRLGVIQSDIRTKTDNEGAEVEYVLKGQLYTFSSTMQRGIETTEQAFAGYEALPSGNEEKDPYRELGFTTKVPLDEARSKYKQLARTHHPDRGGNPETFHRIQKAFREIEVAEGADAQ